MRILVTGDKGYIGAVLVPMLLERGHEVVGLDSDIFRSCTFGKFSNEVESLQEDIRDVSAADLRMFDAIIHLAGLSNDPLGDLDPELTMEINFRASVRLAILARDTGVKRFIFSSSCSTYGASGDDFIDENGSLCPVTPYGRSKVLVEEALKNLSGPDFSPTFLRNATAYGMSPRIRFDLVLNNLVAWAYTTGKVYLKSDGRAWRPLVHVKDISRAFVSVLEAPLEAVHNRAFNVGRTDQNYQVRDLAVMVRKAVPDCQLEYARDAGPDKRCYRVNCDNLARTVPGFVPAVTANEGIAELYQAYQTNGLNAEEFESARYKRIAHVQELISHGKLDKSLRWTH